jgi:nitrogen fixation NifU-like protein
MAELVAGHSPAEAEAIRLAFVALMHSRGADEPDEDVLGDGVAFAGVARYPARIKCALLPWMALQDAQARAGLLDQEDEA